MTDVPKISQLERNSSLQNTTPMLVVRELQKEDLPYLIQYWLHNDPDYMIGMGVDLEKLPPEEGFRKMLLQQIALPIAERGSYAIIWELDGQAVGHSNVNQIIFGKSAFMHLHLWNGGHRKKGLGLDFIKMTIPYFFKNLELEELFCEPYAHNPAPNKTLEKLGFTFIKKHICIPGSLNFEQEVNRWRLSAAEFKEQF